MIKKWHPPRPHHTAQSQWAIGEHYATLRFTGPQTFQASLGQHIAAPSPKERVVLIMNDMDMARGTLKPERHCPWSMLPAKARLMASEQLHCNPHDLAIDYTIEKNQLRWWALPVTMIPSKHTNAFFAIEPASQAMHRGFRYIFPEVRHAVIILQPHSPQQFHCTLLQNNQAIHHTKQKAGDCFEWAKQYDCQRWIWMDPGSLIAPQKVRRPEWVPPTRWLKGRTITKIFDGDMPDHWRGLRVEQLLILGGGALRQTAYGD